MFNKVKSFFNKKRQEKQEVINQVEMEKERIHTEEWKKAISYTRKHLKKYSRNDLEKRLAEAIIHNKFLLEACKQQKLDFSKVKL